MRAAYITELGSAETIRIGELPRPTVSGSDVLVRTQALSVNYVDTLIRSGRYPTRTPFPFVIGRDLVGIVAACGEGVDRFRAGDAVWCNSLGHDGRQGSFAEYVIVPDDRLYRLPDGADAADTVALVH